MGRLLQQTEREATIHGFVYWTFIFTILGAGRFFATCKQGLPPIPLYISLSVLSIVTVWSEVRVRRILIGKFDHPNVNILQEHPFLVLEANEGKGCFPRVLDSLGVL